MKVDSSNQVQENELAVFKVVYCTTSKISYDSYSCMHQQFYRPWFESMDSLDFHYSELVSPFNIVRMYFFSMSVEGNLCSWK